MTIKSQERLAEYAAIVTDEDDNNEVFDAIQEAEIEAAYCQSGTVIDRNNPFPDRPVRGHPKLRAHPCST
jgi:hypothetical protein